MGNFNLGGVGVCGVAYSAALPRGLRQAQISVYRVHVPRYSPISSLHFLTSTSHCRKLSIHGVAFQYNPHSDLCQLMANKTVVFALLSFSFLQYSLAFSLDLCPLNATDEIFASNVTWGDVLNQTILKFHGASYLRPDIGGALLPWVYTAVVIIVHIPVVVIRVVRWEAVQTWCMAATLLTIIVTVQAYVSTKFQAEKILTWTPLLLVIDAGSMAQVLFLLVEDKRLLSRFAKALFASKKAKDHALLTQGQRSGPNPGIYNLQYFTVLPRLIVS